MRLHLGLLVVATMMFGGIAHAQTATGASAPSMGYVVGVAQSAFGNRTSQSYGAEIGIKVWDNLMVYVEGGKVRDVAPSSLGASAQIIAAHMTTIQSGVSHSAVEPATFGIAGLKYLIPVQGKVQPYVMGGGGIARLTLDVHFLVNGTDVTSTLAADPFRIVLGSDLAGQYSKPIVGFGGGVVVPIWERLIFDLQYRYGRILDGDKSINLHRAGAGIGVRF